MQVKSHTNIQWCLNFGIHWISFNWCFWLIGYLSLINCCITTCVTISVIFLMKFFFDMFSVAHFGPKTIHQIKVDNCVGAVKLENDAENFHLFIFSNSVLIIFAELYISLNLPTSFCCSATSIAWSSADSLEILSGSLAHGDFLNETLGTFSSIYCFRYFL